MSCGDADWPMHEGGALFGFSKERAYYLTEVSGSLVNPARDGRKGVGFTAALGALTSPREGFFFFPFYFYFFFLAWSYACRDSAVSTPQVDQKSRASLRKSKPSTSIYRSLVWPPI